MKMLTTHHDYGRTVILYNESAREEAVEVQPMSFDGFKVQPYKFESSKSKIVAEYNGKYEALDGSYLVVVWDNGWEVIPVAFHKKVDALKCFHGLAFLYPKVLVLETSETFFVSPNEEPTGEDDDHENNSRDYGARQMEGFEY